MRFPNFLKTVDNGSWMVPADQEYIRPLVRTKLIHQATSYFILLILHDDRGSLMDFLLGKGALLVCIYNLDPAHYIPEWVD